jgi:hypothetical protein
MTPDEELKGIQFQWATKHSAQSFAQETHLSGMVKCVGTISCMNHILRCKSCGRPLIQAVPVEKSCRERRHHVAADCNIMKNVTALDINERILVMVLLDYCVRVSCPHCC